MKKSKSLDKVTKKKEPRIPIDPLIDSDDSDNEDVLVRTGNIPLKWYDGLKHIGYDIHSQKILKEKQDDKIDKLIERTENKDWWRTIRDELNQRDIILTDEQLELIDRIRNRKYADKNLPETDFTFQFDYPDKIHPVNQSYPSKKKFMPSKWERIKINHLVQAIKLGWIKLDKQDKEKEEEMAWDVWEGTTDQNKDNLPPFISAPKLKLPSHAESYNPSEEYLFDDEEKAAWEKADPDDRTIDFIPQKYSALRKVPAYQNLAKERFERCLDLYLCPRVRKKKLNIDPELLMPNLPKPSELRPFPTISNIIYKGHEARVRAISLNSTGQYMATGDESGKVIIWDVLISRILTTYQFEGIVYSLDWSKMEEGGLLCICYDTYLCVIIPPMLPQYNKTRLENKIEDSADMQRGGVESPLNWKFYEQTTPEYSLGYRLLITFDYTVKSLTIHPRGDFIATVSPNISKTGDQVFVHSLSKAISQRPFTKSKNNIQKVSFHPTKALMFIVTQKHTYIYNLQKQQLVKKLVSGAKFNSSIAVHPTGDNILVGTYDKRVIWFDLDLGDTPYKTLRYHQKAVRQVVFHPTYPLFASCGDDGNVNIFHATVFNDLMQNALIVPLKILKGHKIKDELGVLDITFHPKQPWIFSCGADHNVILWT